jgi:hypothetical protein
MIAKTPQWGVSCLFGITDVVHQMGKSLHSIRDEIVRWGKILDVPYREYLLFK